MNAKSLQCFIKVYENKSITAAAKEVFISPQGLSKVIKQLEIDLEAELFYRGAQGMEATESGELLYARARHICYLMEDIKKEISIINGSKGALNVVVSYSTALAVPLDFLFRFTEVYPNIQLNIREYPDEYPIKELFEEDADVGIVIGTEGVRNCNCEMIVPGEVVVVVPADHRLASHERISLSELKDEGLVLKAGEAGKEHSFVAQCLERGFSPRILYETGNITSLHALCEANGLVGVSADFIETAFAEPDLRVLRLNKSISQNIYLVSRERNIQNRAVSLFQRYVKENIAQ